MRNPHGSFIWYELLTSDIDAAAAFYGEVVGWSASGSGQPDMDYRIFSTKEASVAGHMAMPPGAAEAGMRPVWLGYIGVDDVDAAVAGIEAADGRVQMKATDIEGVGRIAMVADPQGIPFYVMRGAVDQPSTAFAQQVGHCAWNELAAPDQAAALDFYTRQFGWKAGDAMPMGEMGDYRFLEQDGAMIGAVMTAPPGAPALWRFYFQVADIDASAASIRSGGGTIHHGPAAIPGGDHIVVASDPQGAQFGLVGPRTRSNGGE